MHSPILQLRRALAARRRDVVVLLHSSAGSSRQWTRLAARLAARYDVRTPDLWGHGARGPWPGPAPLTLAGEAALLEPILAEGRPVHLVGHAYGGAVALKAAALHPGAFQSIAVYEPVLFGSLFAAAPDSAAAAEVRTLAATMRKYLERGDAARAAAPFVNYWSGEHAWESAPGARRDAIAQRMRAVLAHFEALSADPLPYAELRRVDAALLVLSGADTRPSTAGIAALLREWLPAARHAVLPGMGHLGPITHGFDIDRCIERFVDGAVQASEFPPDRAGPAAAVPGVPRGPGPAYA